MPQLRHAPSRRRFLGAAVAAGAAKAGLTAVGLDLLRLGPITPAAARDVMVGRDGILVVDCAGSTREAQAQSAIDQAHAHYLRTGLGRRIVFPAEVMEANLLWKSGAYLQGEGMDTTVIRSKPNARTHVLSGGTAALPMRNFGLEKIRIDGAKASHIGSNDPDGVSGIDIIGSNFHFEHFKVVNCLGHGVHLGHAGDGAAGTTLDDYSGYSAHGYIQNCGRHGVWAEGPHDLHVGPHYVVNASGEADDVYCGWYSGDLFNGRIERLHCWCSGDRRNFPRFAASFSSNHQVLISHFEGCRRQLELRGDQNTVTSAQIYAPRSQAPNAAMVVVVGDSNQIRGGVIACPEQTGEYTADLFGVQFGTDAHNATGNTLEGVHFAGFRSRGPFNFYRDNGNRAVKCTGFVKGAGGAKPDAGLFPTVTPPGESQGTLGISLATEWEYHQRGATEYRIVRVPYQFEDRITATGSGAADAYQLTCQSSRVTRRTKTDFGVKLRPSSVYGSETVVVRNLGDGNIVAYPGAGDSFDTTVNGGAYVVIEPGRGVMFGSVAPTVWSPSYLTPPTLN